MDYPMLQPQIECKTAGYSFEIKENICRAAAYALPRPDKFVLLPDGCEEIIMAWGAAAVFSVRPDKTVRTELEPPLDCRGLCGVRIEPGCTVNITDAKIKVMHAELTSAQSPAEARDIILHGMLPLIEKRKVSPVWEKMAETVCGSCGRSTVASLAEQFGYTVRHVNNLFRECAGYSPKTFCRFVRFQNALLEMTKNPARENSEFIERLSYSDQAHFQREFKCFTGMTPRQFVNKYL